MFYVDIRVNALSFQSGPYGYAVPLEGSTGTGDG